MSKTDTLKYRGYEGSVLYSEEDHCLYGEVLNTGKDVLLFEGMSLKELEDDFRATIDQYLNREVKVASA